VPAESSDPEVADGHPTHSIRPERDRERDDGERQSGSRSPPRARSAAAELHHRQETRRTTASGSRMKKKSTAAGPVATRSQGDPVAVSASTQRPPGPPESVRPDLRSNRHLEFGDTFRIPISKPPDPGSLIRGHGTTADRQDNLSALVTAAPGGRPGKPSTNCPGTLPEMLHAGGPTPATRRTRRSWCRRPISGAGKGDPTLPR